MLKLEIALSPEELKQCKEFSAKCACNQQEIEFGERSTTPRGKNEITRDNLIGKIAEVAFKKILLEKYNIEIALDFNHYSRGQWDDQDTVINDWSIDIKGTRQGGHWLLVEWNKIKFRYNEKKLPHLFVMCSVMWNREKDSPTGRVQLVGAVPIQRLQAGIPYTKVLRKGSFIPGTKSKLQTDNFGIEFHNLNTNWNEIIEHLRNIPPTNNHESYPNIETVELLRLHKY